MSDEEVPAGEQSVAVRLLDGGWDRWLADGRFGLSTRAWQALVAIVAAGLLARLVALGARTMHFDEARVAYWTLRSAETGHFEYRFIIHGPLLQHVDRWLFAVAGPSDALARLPVALVGALLPLAALLFRRHLRDEEVVGLALFLAGSPILLYYSRFMRSDVLVAAFMFVAFGLLVRLADTRDVRYLYAASAAVALGFAAKENALVYLLVWLGAGLLVVDTGLFRPRSAPSGLARVETWLRRVREFAREDPARARRLALTYGGHALGAALLALAVTLFMFAPRAGEVGGVGLWSALASPGQLPDLLRTTGGDIERGLRYWFGQGAETKCFEETIPAGYACFLGRYLETMATFAAALGAFAAVGIVLERYAAAPSRTVVVFASYWGVASVLGYPLGMDIWAAWPVIHALVPLAIPAAVAFGSVVRRGVAAVERDDRPVAGLATVLLVLSVGVMGVTGAEAAYLDPQTRDSETDMVQFAQPSEDMRPGLAAMAGAVAGNDGLDVLYYGERYFLNDEGAVALPPPADPSPDHGTGGWFHRLPLPWYTERLGATVDSVEDRTALADALERDPPVVIAEASLAADVAGMTSGYDRYRYDLRAHTSGPQPGTSVVIFVREADA